MSFDRVATDVVADNLVLHSDDPSLAPWGPGGVGFADAGQGPFNGQPFVRFHTTEPFIWIQPFVAPLSGDYVMSFRVRGNGVPSTYGFLVNELLTDITTGAVSVTEDAGNALSFAAGDLLLDVTPEPNQVYFVRLRIPDLVAGRSYRVYAASVSIPADYFARDFEVRPYRPVSVVGLPAGYSVQIGTSTLVIADASGRVVTNIAGDTVADPMVVTDSYGAVVESFTPEDAPIAAGEGYRFMTPVADWMYGRLPSVVRFRDDQGGNPLADLVRVLGFGLQETKDQAEHLVDLIDVDSCPAEFLPQMGALLGFEFPYDLTEDLQRNFIRSAVSLYRIKGTVRAMKLVVNRIIAGRGFNLAILNEDHIAKTFDVQLSADDSSDTSGALQDKITYLVGVYSPAGMIPNVVILYQATESFDATRQRDDHTTTAYTRWAMNVPGHKFNTVAPGGAAVSFNTLGQQTLTI